MQETLAATVGQWKYLGCHCIVKFFSSGGVSFTYQCDACGNTNLRFIHTLGNTENGRQINVGLDCARQLLEGSDVPVLAENETKRKERWRRDVFRRPGRCSTTIDDLIERGKL
jgi:hypothetical protein